MKKLSALLLALLLLAAQAGALAEEAAADEEPTVYQNLRVGNPTPMRGEFFTELWGNATSDIDVRDLLHGYNLIMWDGDNSMFTVDPSVVSGLAVMENQTGDRSFVMVLYDNLFYSDGTKITAWDYAFSYLFQIAPEIEQIGGRPIRMEHLLGYEAYLNGTSRGLAGMRVLADDTLMVTISHEYLPFFYEMGLLMCNPYPIRVIAPGVTVRDDGQGAYLANEDPAQTEPLFTADLLRRTVMDPETGYMSHPSVVSGPYTLTSWDGETGEFAINPYYKGNAQGQVPTIPTLTYTLCDNETMMDKLLSGEFGLLDKVMRADTIMAGMAGVQEDACRMSAYPRIGMGYISFICEKPTVSSQAVRQAIAWCLDRDQVTEDYTGGFGQRVDGYYGIGQWMYGIITGTTPVPVDPPENEHDAQAQAEYEETLAAYEELSLDQLTAYTVETERAAALLDADGWQLNADGIREKIIDGTAVTLDLTMIYPEGNNIVDSFTENFLPHLEEVGIRLTMQAVPMGELLTRYYKQDGRDMDMIFLASNFDIVFDPAVNFIVDASGAPNWSYTNHTDEELYRLALAMRRTEPGDVLGYMQNWVAFQERFNQTLPMLPIYGNIYFDFYTPALHNFPIAESVTWGQAIVGAYMSDEEETTEEPDGDGNLVEFD